MPSVAAGPNVVHELSGDSGDGDASPLSSVEHIGRSGGDKDIVQISWTGGSRLHVSLLSAHQGTDAENGEGGAVFRIQWNALTPKRRRIAFESLPHFATLQQQKQATRTPAFDLSESSMSIWSPETDAGWQHFLDYSVSISRLLCPKKLGPPEVSDRGGLGNEGGGLDLGTILSKAVWDLASISYVQSGGERNVTECLVDWLMENGRLLTGADGRDSIHNNLLKLRQDMMRAECPEQLGAYWDGLVACVAVGWLNTACALLRRHSAFNPDECGMREEEAGVVEVMIKLLEEMPRLCSDDDMAPALSAGTSFVSVAEFTKTLDRWRGRLARLEAVPQWQECSVDTMDGLKRLINQLLGRREPLAFAGHWIELVVAHLLHVKPHTQTVEGLEVLIRRNMKVLGAPQTPKLQFDRLLLAILLRDTETVLSECSRMFDSWMMVHVAELLTARNQHAHAILMVESEALGGVSLEEMYRQQYAQELLSHGATWQLAPTYLSCCPRNGMAVLRTALERLPFRSGDDRLVLKALDVCEHFSLDDTAMAICRKVGVSCWKQNRKGAAIAWLQRARDDARLSSIANSILDDLTSGSTDTPRALTLADIGTLLDNARAPAGASGTLGFLQRFLDLARSLEAARALRALQRPAPADLEAAGACAAAALLRLLRPQAAPSKLWAFLLSYGIELLDWPERPLIGPSDTLALISQLQELSSSHQREESLSHVCKTGTEIPILERVRLALARNLSRAMLQVPTSV